MSLTEHVASLAETERFAKRLAAALEPGTTIALDGPLGAGKTTLVRALCAALGVDEHVVASPTFVLLHQYQGRFAILHFDAYRVGSIEEFLELGTDECFESDAISIVEWASRVAEALPVDRLSIRIEIQGEAERAFLVSTSGPKAERVLKRLASGAQR